MNNYCVSCGSQLGPGITVCPNCGSPIQTQPAMVPQQPVYQQQPMYQQPVQQYQNNGLRCPRCGGIMNFQVVNEVTLKNQHHGLLWWLFIGWWWVPFKWLVFTIPALIIKLLGHKKQKAVNTQKRIAVCQQCGNTMNY